MFLAGLATGVGLTTLAAAVWVLVRSIKNMPSVEDGIDE